MIHPATRSEPGSDRRRELHLMFGGTFDPVHNGHLRMALELRETVQREASEEAHIHLVPCHVPPHRDIPGANAGQRLQMLLAATGGEPGLMVDQRELKSAEPSYSVNTLMALRDELGPDVPLAMAIGTDSYAAIDQWHQWQQIINLAHIVVIDRPGYAIAPGTEADNLLSLRKVSSFAELMQAPAGGVLPVALSLLDISATDIRSRVANGRSARYLLPDTVWHYICHHSLYQAQ